MKRDKMKTRFTYPVERQSVLAQLEAADCRVTSSAIEEETNLCQWGVFLCAMDLLGEGYPICFSNSEGHWLNFTESDGDVEYWLTTDVADLLEVVAVVDEQWQYLSEIRAGISRAKRDLQADELATAHCVPL